MLIADDLLFSDDIQTAEVGATGSIETPPAVFGTGAGETLTRDFDNGIFGLTAVEFVVALVALLATISILRKKRVF